MIESGLRSERTVGYLIRRQLVFVLVLLLGVFLGNVSADGGDFSLDFAAAAPYTYDHANGGGAWNDGTIGKSEDVVESLEGSDFACGDNVTHLLKISVDDQTSAANQTIELDFSFLADTTGQSGVALGDITFVGVNYGNVENGGGGGPGTFGSDGGILDDGGSTALLVSEYLTGPKFVAGSELRGTVRIDDFEASEVVILRIDTRLECLAGSNPTGNLQSDIIDARVISQKTDTIQVGNQTVPFLKLGKLAFPEVDLNVEKLDSPDPVELTQALTYTIEVSNNSGDNIAENVTLSDTLDPNTAFLSINPATGCSHDGSLSGGVISCDIGALNPNETRIYDVMVTVLVTAPDEGDGGSGTCSETSDLCNQVAVATTTLESNLDNNSDSEPTDVIITGPFGAIEIDKQPDSGTVYPGTEYTYNYFVSHPGSIGPVLITDLSDDKCAPVTTIDDDADTFNDGDSNSDGFLDPGETWLYSCTTELTEDTTNIATVFATDYWTDIPLQASDSAYVNVINPALTIDKQVDQTTVLAGTVVNYTFVVSNSGDDPLESITVTDTIEGEAGCSPVSYDSGDDGNNVLDLAESWTFTCSAQIDEDTHNIATASGYDSLSNETVSAPDDAYVDVVHPDITLEKSSALTTDLGQDGEPGTGDTLTYTYLITNSGDTTLDNVTLSDDNQGFGTLGTFNCDTTLPADDMQPGATITCTAEYVIKQADVDAGSIYNLATTIGTPPLGDNVDDKDAVIVDLPQHPAMTLEKSGTFNDENGDGFADVGETITYSFSITNTGNVTLHNITLTDPNITILGGPLATLAVGASDSSTFSGSYVVTQADIDAGFKYNLATADSNETDEVTDDHTTPLPQNPDIDLLKSYTSNADEDGSATISLGDTLTYNFTVSNSGNVTLTSVAVTDPMPGLSSISCPANFLSVGASMTCSATYVVTQADVNSGNIHNTATASGLSPKGDPVSAIDSEDVTVPSGTVTLLKLTNGEMSTDMFWDFTLNGPGISTSDSTTNLNNLLDFGAPRLSVGVTYTVCETDIWSGWTSVWRADIDRDGNAEIIPAYNPNATDEPPQDLGVRCYDFTVQEDETLAFEVDNRYPGGDPRTIGYWKNWNTCSGGNQHLTAAKLGGPDAGVYILNDILNSPGVTLGNFPLGPEDCEAAVNILDKSDVRTGKKRANDAAYALASQLLAAKLNHAAGAETCTAVQQAILEADQLLIKIGFDGTGRYLDPKHKGNDRTTALELANTLDLYNNGELCD